MAGAVTSSEGTPTGAVSLCARLRARELSCSEAVSEFLAGVSGDPMNAWATVDGDRLMADAQALDRLGPEGQGPLFGLPIAVKDNFDTAGLVTTYGSPIYSDHRPAADAELVSGLSGAGALVAGKTKCAEFAWVTPPDTVNPLDPERTPGGSSNGSAAAVAAGQVTVATGTQTAGSVIRPASYCGIVGYKPTFGLLPLTGVMPMAPSLDTAGLLARSVEDVALVAAALGLDAGGALTGEPTPPPRLAFVPTPMWDDIEPEARAASMEAIAAVTHAGASIEMIEPETDFAQLNEAQAIIQWYESTRSLEHELTAAPDLLSPELRKLLAEGAQISDARYAAARAVTASVGAQLGPQLAGWDGWLTPSTTGVPPLGLGFTGAPTFCRAWTLIGAPCVSLPLAWTPDGLPAGLQLVGAPRRDAQTLRTAAWLMGHATPPEQLVRQ
jgi:Asp-tRNA(Asn)/Glu-tRNA(Gln) amidotransferase A subunit family amidase